ncbi:MAG: 2-acylglycerophosphoethanolamine acyltransferase [Ponticaulis sp.]|nr:2-acylglycerophosphoethanolamine acyltransferase [Ponticaulis sp.]|tara:strand:+ start:20616 stop:22196 length:1581 start_codon:yes stop_codon:yes gene_type:complete
MTAIAYEFRPGRTRQNLFSGLLKAKSQFGGNKEIIVDGDERVLTYNEIIQAAFALGSALKRQTEKGESVAVMLPTGAGAVIAFYALQAYGRVPAMFNFTAGSRNLKAAGRAAKVTKLVTARRFIDIGNLQPLIDELGDSYELIYLENVKDGLTLTDKLAGGLGPYLPSLFKANPGHKETGVILFTSGTEGDPKGVVLSHENVMANVEQVRAHIELFPEKDVLFNPLPTFHCFGLTVGAVLPIAAGIKSVFHPTPLQPKEIVKRIKKYDASILLATDTFISQYARAGDQGDLNSLRLAVCGAERVRDETRQMVRKKYNIEILEGYGATEASPVVAANSIGANVPGTVGQLMSGMEHKLEPVPGIEQGGRMFVRGPNIMKGYLRASSPGVLEPPKGGWHDTGDICTVDKDGFIRIRGRVKRFAKVGGEMISLAVVENCASAIWPDNMHAAATIPDPRKGEQIVLLSDADSVNRPDMLAWAQNHGVSELSVPRKVFKVDAIPVLGTGKIDYGAVSKLAYDLAGVETPAA